VVCRLLEFVHRAGVHIVRMDAEGRARGTVCGHLVGVGTLDTEDSELAQVLPVATQVVAPRPETVPGTIRDTAQEQQSALSTGEQLQHTRTAGRRAPRARVGVQSPDRPFSRPEPRVNLRTRW